MCVLDGVWWGCLYAYATDVCVEIRGCQRLARTPTRGHLPWVGSLLPCGFQGLNLGHQAHVPIEKSCWPPCFCFFFNEWINSSLTVIMFICLHLKVDFSIFSLSPLFLSPFIFFLFFCTPVSSFFLFWWVSHILFWSPTGYVAKDDFMLYLPSPRIRSIYYHILLTVVPGIEVRAFVHTREAFTNWATSLTPLMFLLKTKSDTSRFWLIGTLRSQHTGAWVRRLSRLVGANPGHIAKVCLKQTKKWKQKWRYQKFLLQVAIIGKLFAWCCK